MKNFKETLWIAVFAIIAKSSVVQSQDPTNPCFGTTELVRIPDIEDCSRFFLCVNGEAFSQECSPGLIFDVITNNCNFKEVSVCIQEVLTPPTPGGPGESTVDPTDPNTTTPNGEEPPEAPTPTPSPPPTAQTPSPTPSPTTTPSTVPTPPPTTTPAPPVEGAPHCPPGEIFYAPHPDCTRFFRCVFGTLFELQCPPNHHWNQDREYCDHPWNVPCHQ